MALKKNVLLIEKNFCKDRIFNHLNWGSFSNRINFTCFYMFQSPIPLHPPDLSLELESWGGGLSISSPRVDPTAQRLLTFRVRISVTFCGWLVEAGVFSSAKTSLDYFGNRRTDKNVSKKFQGVETPSQYVKYLQVL